jgi:hypothetical protein
MTRLRRPQGGASAPGLSVALLWTWRPDRSVSRLPRGGRRAVEEGTPRRETARGSRTAGTALSLARAGRYPPRNVRAPRAGVGPLALCGGLGGLVPLSRFCLVSRCAAVFECEGRSPVRASSFGGRVVPPGVGVRFAARAGAGPVFGGGRAAKRFS